MVAKAFLLERRGYAGTRQIIMRKAVVL